MQKKGDVQIYDYEAGTKCETWVAFAEKPKGLVADDAGDLEGYL